MTAQLAPTPIFKAWDNNGLPLFLGQLFTYAAGTTNPQATYTDSTQTTQNTNPVILNARGEANVWLNPTLAYKLVLQDSFGNQIWIVDNIQGVLGPSNNIIPSADNQFSLGNASFRFSNGYFGIQLYVGANNTPVLNGGIVGYWPQTAAEIAAVVTPTNYAYPEGYLERYGGTVGNNCDTALAAAISVMTAKGGGTIYALGSGSYIFANAYTFPASTGIQGNGYGTKLQYTGSGSFLTFGHTSSRAWLANLQILGTSQTGVGLTLGDTTANGGFCKLTGVLFSGWATAMRMGGATWLTCEKCEFGNAAGGVGVITNNVGIDFNYFGGNNYSSGLTFKDCVISNNANAGVQATNVSVTMNGVAWINCTVQNNCQSATGNPQFYMGNVLGFVIDTLYMEYTLGGTNPDALKASNLNNGQIRSIFINGAANGIKDGGGGAMNHVEIIGAQIFNITTGDAVNCAGETDVRLRCSSITGTVVLTGTGCEVLSSNFLTASWPVNETNFAPVLTPASGAITQTGQGTYSQVGNTVNFTLRIDWSSLSTGSGALTITGLPIAPKSGLKDVAFSVGYFNGVTLASGQQLVVFIPNGSTTATLYLAGAASTGATVAQLATSGSIIISGSYQV